MNLTVKFVVVVLIPLICSVFVESRADEPTDKSDSGAVSDNDALPPSIKLQPEFERLGLVQRSQGARGTCSVFATVESVEFAVAKLRGNGGSLSVEFANWAANDACGRSDDGDFFHNIIFGLQKYGICPEATFPYADSFTSDAGPSEAALAEADQFKRDMKLNFHWLKRWEKSPGLSDKDLKKIKEVLASGYPVSAGSDHSVLFVGYEDNEAFDGGGRLFISDSNLREKEISYQAAKARFCDMFWVSAALVEDDENAEISKTIAAFSNYDINGDGIVEIEQLNSIADDLAATQPLESRLLLVLIEDRLLSAAPAAEQLLMPRLQEYQKQLRKDGWNPVLVRAKLYAGNVHQDGRTVLAIRRFFQATRKQYPNFGGAVLVGSFPESMLVRRWSWMHNERSATFKGVTYNNGSGPKATFIAMDPELISARTDVILCDLDGRWEDIYVQPKTKIDSISFLLDQPVPRGGPTYDVPFETSNFAIKQKSFEDFFFIDDVEYEILERTAEKLTIHGSYGMLLPEVSEADRKQPNPLATSEIIVSRINPLHIAVAQPEENLDSSGKPRSVAGSKGSPNNQFRRDPALEVQLLAEYFDRNFAHRRGENRFESQRVAALTTDLQTPSKQYFNSVAQGLGESIEFPRANAVDFARFMKTPAIIKGVSAHSDPSCSMLMRGYKQSDLIHETGEGIWFWTLAGDQWIPSYNHSSVRDRVHFSLLRTLWRNGKLNDAGSCFYVHGGCEAISPLNAMDHSYNAPEYGGHTQIAENLLFYGNGLALIGRSKVFYDVPTDFGGSFNVEKGCFGDVLKNYIAKESEDSHLARRVADRNKSYFWSIIGDWTLRLKYSEEP